MTYKMKLKDEYTSPFDKAEWLLEDLVYGYKINKRVSVVELPIVATSSDSLNGKIKILMKHAPNDKSNPTLAFSETILEMLTGIRNLGIISDVNEEVESYIEEVSVACLRQYEYNIDYKLIIEQ